MEILPVNKGEREKDILWLFDFTLILKLIGGAVDLLEGVLVLVVPPSLALKAVLFITGSEFAEEHPGLIAALLRDIAQSLAVHAHYLIALYLALHGAIKILLVIGIFLRKRIAYPLFMLGLVLFGGYEAYRGFLRHEVLLQLFAVLDLITLVLTVYEYRRRYPPMPPAHEASPASFSSGR